MRSNCISVLSLLTTASNTSILEEANAYVVTLAVTVIVEVSAVHNIMSLFCQSDSNKLIDLLADLGSCPRVGSPPIISIASWITSSISIEKLYVPDVLISF